MDPVLLIFAGFAAFVIFRLISVLGTRTGHEQRHDLEGVQRSSRANEALNDNGPLPDDAPTPAPVSAAAAPLREADASFNEKAFLEGASVAYEMIVEAFAAGDLKSIRRFISESVYEAFKKAIGDREAGGYSSELKFVGLDDVSISSSVADGDMLRAVTDFRSNQVRVTRDKDGNVIDGDPTRIDLVRDRWTFSRKLNSGDPNWILVATGGAV